MFGFKGISAIDEDAGEQIDGGSQTQLGYMEGWPLKKNNLDKQIMFIQFPSKIALDWVFSILGHSFRCS